MDCIDLTSDGGHGLQLPRRDLDFTRRTMTSKSSLLQAQRAATPTWHQATTWIVAEHPQCIFDNRYLEWCCGRWLI
jgi:hypothetical protein